MSTDNSLQLGKYKNQSILNISNPGPATKSLVGGGKKGGRLATAIVKSLGGAALTAEPSTSRSQGANKERGGGDNWLCEGSPRGIGTDPTKSD